MKEKEKQEIAKVEQEQIVNLNTLMMEAIKTGNIEVLERLMAVRREIQQEKARQEFLQAIKNFQAEVKPIRMDCVVRNKDGSVRYRYASYKQIMNEIRPLLDKYGLSVSFDTEPSQGNALEIKCIITHQSGHKEVSTFKIPIDTSQHMSDIQRWGSTLSYAKRYALTSALNLIAEEDIDGLESQKRQEEIKVKKITILDDGTVIEQNEEQEMKQKQVKEIKQEAKQEEKKKKEQKSEQVIQDEKKLLLEEIRRYYKILLNKYEHKVIEAWLWFYDTRFEKLVDEDIEKVKKVRDLLKEEAEKIIK